MQGRPVVSQEWSVHAQLTISHHAGNTGGGTTTTTSTSADPAGGGVRMEYSWDRPSPPPPPPPPPVARPCYEFQRGNILFTTRPAKSRLDSGYSSEQVSPGSYGSLPSRRPVQPYSRRCKSTCSIVLSDPVVDPPTPTPDCGDRNCYHHHQQQQQFSCEVCGSGGGRSPTSIRRANTFTSHFCTRVPGRETNKVPDKVKEEQPTCNKLPSRDAAIQTSVTSLLGGGKKPKMGGKAVTTRRRTEPALLQIPTPPDQTETKKPGNRLTRSPAIRSPRSQSPLRKSASTEKSTTAPAASTSAPRKPPRTVHIDVYCTGSEDADASSTSDDTDSTLSDSTPQTVFESEDIHVMHTRMGKDRLPAGYILRQQQQKNSKQAQRSSSYKHEELSSTAASFARGYDSDDGLSSQYPSRLSSCSQIPLSDTPATSRDPSYSTISSPSIMLSEDCDISSWKDTDLESVLQSTFSLAQSDSFEYADAMDRLRIKEKERAWAEGDSKTWRSPEVERKHMLQQHKLKQFLEKSIGEKSLPVWKVEQTTEDSDDDETGDAWSFCSRDTLSTANSPRAALRREGTVVERVPAVNPAQHQIGSPSDSGPHRFVPRDCIGPFGSRSPSPPPAKVSSSITSPFTSVPGARTDQLSRAEKFGTIVGAFRKPGHHVGPSKNPECRCEHCRKFYEGGRIRTKSVGEAPEGWVASQQSPSEHSADDASTDNDSKDDRMSYLSDDVV